MSGGLFVHALGRETGRQLDEAQVNRLQDAHVREFLANQARVRLLPGAKELLQHLTASGIPWAIATSGSDRSAGPALKMLAVPKDAVVVTRDQVPFAKPDPHLFLKAAERLHVEVENAIVVGDSVW